MSADNGIYIAKCQDGYRVAEAQAIDNCFLNRDSFTQELEDAYRFLYFGDSKLFNSLESARLYASEIELDIYSSDIPILEYGICLIDFSDRPFIIMTKEEAEEINDSFERV